jgi:hypothetical protein
MVVVSAKADASARLGDISFFKLSVTPLSGCAESAEHNVFKKINIAQYGFNSFISQ